MIQMSKRNFSCVCFTFWIYQRIQKTRKFLVGPETFGLMLLVSFLVLVSVPVSQNLNFLVLFRYPLWSYLRLPGFVPVPGTPLSFVPQSQQPLPFQVLIDLRLNNQCQLVLGLTTKKVPSLGESLSPQLKKIELLQLAYKNNTNFLIKPITMAYHVTEP